MAFQKLISLVEQGTDVDVFTIIDSTDEASALVGETILLHAEGSWRGKAPETLVERLQQLTEETNWDRPETIWVDDADAVRYRVFWERDGTRSKAIVLGAGHVSQPVAQMLALINFEVTVVDDRMNFANAERFPTADTIICDEFSHALRTLSIDEDTAVIIVTRGHRYDLACLRATLASSARYLGMIGSRRRVGEIMTLLREEGVPAALVERVRAPIGLDIQAETPAEIAVSIVAEVIAAFKGGSGLPLRDKRGRG